MDMSGDMDASVKLLYATDLGTFLTVDEVALDDSFDVIMNVEIGQDLNQVVTRYTARVGIRNLTQSKTVATIEDAQPLTPAASPFFQELRLNIPAGWSNGGTDAQPGDVLQAVASYKVEAGVNTDLSMAESVPFIVS